MLQPKAPFTSSSFEIFRNAVVKHNPKHAKVNMMNTAQVEDSLEVIMGNLPVNNIPAKVLFDTGASHCFMSRPFFAKHEFTSSHLGKPMDNVVGLSWQMPL